jgi:fructose-1-phosphate kinase PfkB-like protein
MVANIVKKLGLASVAWFAAGGDFQRYYSASISPIDSQDAGPLAFDGEPRN